MKLEPEKEPQPEQEVEEALIAPDAPPLRVRVDARPSLQIVWLREREVKGRAARTACLVDGDPDAVAAVGSVWAHLEPSALGAAPISGGYRSGPSLELLPPALGRRVREQLAEWRATMSDPGDLAVDLFFLDETLVVEATPDGLRFRGLRSGRSVDEARSDAVRPLWAAAGVPLGAMALTAAAGGMIGGFWGLLGGALIGVLVGFGVVTWRGAPGQGGHGRHGPRG